MRAINLATDFQSFRLGPILVDPARSVVQGPFGERHLEPKVMAVLVYLAQRPEKVISRTELLDNVWTGVVVGDQVLTRCISELRRQLEDNATAPNYVQTISKRGYRLVAEPLWETNQNELDDRSEPLWGGSDSADNTVAIVPLEMLSPAPTEQVLSVGIGRDLTQLLSLVPGLKVVPYTSVEHAAKEVGDPLFIGTKLSARYVVCGAIEYRSAIFRLRIELLDVVNNEQLWANKYDADIGELFVVQDELVQQIARSLSTAVELGKVRQIQTRSLFDLGVYERVQLAEDARRNYNREAAEFIVENLTQALSIQPDNGVVHALLAMQYSQNLVSGWCVNPAEVQQLAAKHLRESVRFAPTDSRVLMAVGIAAIMRGEHQEAMQKLAQSLELNPNEPHTLAEYGTARFYVTGELAPSIELMERAEQAAPQHPRYSIWAYRRGICYYEAGEYERSLAAYDESIARTPNYYHTYLTKALALVAMGAEQHALQEIRNGMGYATDLECEDYLNGIWRFKLTTSEDQVAIFRRLWGEAREQLTG